MTINPNILSTLKDKSLLKTQAYINGQWVDANNGKTFEVINPSTNEVICVVPDMGQSETARAIDYAEAAQKLWAAKTAKERSAVLMVWHKLLLENQQDLGAILTAEMGKPLAEAVGEIVYGASFIQWFAEEAKRVYGQTIPGHQSDKRIVVLRQPVGVVGSITPWNFPNAMIARKVSPALAVGCSFVAKPATETPLSALAMVALAERAGLPKGLFNVITGQASAEIGGELCKNPIVRKLTFTGSTGVGRILMRQCADTIKKLSLALGGNAPFIVFNDADIDDVIRQANDTIYGLASYFYANDIRQVWRVAEALEYGMVGVNTGLISTEVAPFGGIKQSGLGREGSSHGLDDYLESKYICFGGI